MLATEIHPLRQDEAEHIINCHLNPPFAQDDRTVPRGGALPALQPARPQHATEAPRPTP